jgi:hypothetical protein
MAAGDQRSVVAGTARSSPSYSLEVEVVSTVKDEG